jgi:hypothetical protein
MEHLDEAVSADQSGYTSGGHQGNNMARILGLGTLLIAVCLVGSDARGQYRQSWHRVPTIVVVSADADPRVEFVEKAVAFWNKTLTETGSAFRLGRITHVVQSPPEEDLQTLSQSVLSQTAGTATRPESLRNLSGDITIFLAQSKFISFTSPFDENSRRVIGIRGTQFPPLNQPNVALNVIAHELGHAIGLRHNSDPSMLMCGRPAPCRPDLFISETPRFFPVTDDEKQRLRVMYPPDWKPE